MKYRFLLLFLAMFASVGCSDEEGALRGSLEEFYNINYVDVRARLYPSELAIEYIRENGQVPVRVTLRRTEGEPIRTGDYDLGTKGNITGRSGDNDIPPFNGGSLTLEEFSASNGASIVGEFSARFRTGEDEAALSGDFDTELEVIENIAGYDADLSYLFDMDMP